MRGRKPKPTVLHHLHGTLNATRHADRALEPTVEGALFTPPSWLSPAQAETWRYAIANAPAGVLHRIDLGVLVVWVEAEDRHRTASIQQSKLDAGNSLPLLTKNKDGLPIPSPYLGILNKAGLTMLKAASELGFSPSSRPRLAAANPGVASPNDSPWKTLRIMQGGKA